MLSPYGVMTYPVDMVVEGAFFEPMAVAGRSMVAKPAKEESGKQEQAEGLPVRDLPETEYFRHQPVPEPLYYNAENEGKQSRHDDPKEGECEDPYNLPSCSPLSTPFSPILFSHQILPPKS
jgi:hypothetical protein